MKKVLLVATVQSHICQFHKPLVEVLHENGVEVHYYDGKEEKDDIVYLLDFYNPANNSFKVVNQWTFVEHSKKRPDVIIFINGMPLVLFELKSPSRAETDVSDAYKQLRQYMKQIPSLFVPNVFFRFSIKIFTKIISIFIIFLSFKNIGLILTFIFIFFFIIIIFIFFIYYYNYIAFFPNLYILFYLNNLLYHFHIL